MAAAGRSVRAWPEWRWSAYSLGWHDLQATAPTYCWTEDVSTGPEVLGKPREAGGNCASMSILAITSIPSDPMSTDATNRDRARGGRGPASPSDEPTSSPPPDQ